MPSGFLREPSCGWPEAIKRELRRRSVLVNSDSDMVRVVLLLQIKMGGKDNVDCSEIKMEREKMKRIKRFECPSSCLRSIDLRGTCGIVRSP